MIRGWDDEDVIDAEEARAKRKEKSGVGCRLISRHHNCPMRGRTDSENFLDRPASSGVLDFFFFNASENTRAVSPSHTSRLSSISLCDVALIDQAENCLVQLNKIKLILSTPLIFER